MAITLQVNNKRYTQFIKAQVNERLDAMCSDFSVVIATDGDTPLPFVGGEACILYVDNVKKMTGFIEVVVPSYNSRSHTITLSGRDKTCDIVDSYLEARDDIDGAISFADVCREVIKQIGADIDVIDISLTPNFNPAEDNVSQESAENAFDFLEGLASKRNLLLTSNADGNLVIKQSVANKSSAKIRNVRGGNNNNVISANAPYDTTDRFNHYIAVSGLNPTPALLTKSIELSNIVNTTSKINDEPLIDTQIRAGRQFVVKPDQSSSDAELQNRAKWELNIRKSRSVQYNVTVFGHTQSANSLQVWETDITASIHDEYCGINDFMLVNKLSFITSIDDGDITEIEFVQKDSYTLTTSEPQNEIGSVGAGFMDFNQGAA